MSTQTTLSLDHDNPLNFFEIAINRPLFQSFTYAYTKDIQPGTRVLVKLGKSTEIGIILSSYQTPPEVDYSINHIEKVIDDSPTLSEEVLQLARWTSQYYYQPIGELIFTFVPNYLKQNKPLTSLHQEAYSALPDIQASALAKNATKQAFALEHLTKHPSCTKEQLTAIGITRNTLSELLKKQLITKHNRAPVATANKPSCAQDNEASLILTEEQSAAVQVITDSKDQFSSFLLEGITGSGKTEVYLHICHFFLARQQQILLLVPEIGLTPQLAERLQSQLNAPVITLHSELANKERAHRWLLTHQETPMVVIGTRSAVACSLPKLSCIILDEEHDASFKQQDGIRYHSRSMAIKRAQLKKIPIVLGSATPSLETLTNADQKRYQHLTLTQRATGAKLPETIIEDTASLPPNELFTEHTLQTINTTLSNNQQVLIFINRRGFAPTLQCSQCHWVAECDHCDIALTVHQSTNSVDCHHCENKHPIPKRCPRCNSPYLAPLGYGTERIETELVQRFSSVPVLRMDRDSTQKKGSVEKIRDQLLQDTPCILVGTQMVSKGHNFPNLTLTVVLNCDNGLYSQDFRAKEHLLQNIIQVAGRSGRGDKPGKVIIQSSFVEHPLFDYIKQQDYRGFAKEELKNREKLSLPPSNHQAAIRMQSLMDNNAYTHLLKIEQALKTYQASRANDHVDISLTMPAAMERKSNWYRYLIMLSSPDRKHLHHYLNVAHSYLMTMPRTKKLKWVIDVDPLDTW